VAELNKADLLAANLNEADLTSADLTSADFTGARLADAHLRDAYLDGADFTDALLNRADLTDIRGYADFSDADVSDAVGITNEQLSHHNTSSLEGATMPNGQKYEDWLKDR